ncbi:CinA family protein [Ornithinimicrobium kibberense]|uniref:CinA family protein n=1 Tax=Ornithinimicrobium kibberense TaxID=282060 RepID=A0ABV5V014_9MICO|nr:nicotinamide-nucleotide amidohydrolase family protein [Ornithinimicrobium kibberense]
MSTGADGSGSCGGPAPGAAARVLELLGGRGETVAAAESLTGGLVCAALTEVPGSSTVVRGGVVSYATGVKRDVLGVPAALLEAHGAVSGPCALAMADGARRLLGADWGLATTGVAGPDPSEGHPVGTVHVAVVGEHGQVHRALHLQGSRRQVRDATVTQVLELLEQVVRQLSVGAGTVEIRSSEDAKEG